jgi:hypothetical protein
MRPADGTIAWNATTLVEVHVEAGDGVGLGYSYTHASAAALITGLLAEVVTGRDPFDIPAAALAPPAACAQPPHGRDRGHRDFRPGLRSGT